jgi:hypothetical protein
MMRAEDRRARCEGREPSGPPWIVLQGRHIRYRRSSVLAWIDANAEERGVVPFSNRGRP